MSPGASGPAGGQVVAGGAAAGGPLEAGEDLGPAAAVLLARRQRIRHRLPAGVLQDHQRATPDRGELHAHPGGDRVVTARMPAEGHHPGRLPFRDRAPDRFAPVRAGLGEDAIDERHLGARSEDAEVGQRPPPADALGEDGEGRRRVGVDEDLAMDRWQDRHGCVSPGVGSESGRVRPAVRSTSAAKSARARSHRPVSHCWATANPSGASAYRLRVPTLW